MMESVDEVHNKMQVAVYSMKQFEVNCLRGISHERDDISERETRLVKVEEEFKKKIAILETEKKILEQYVYQNLPMAPTEINNTCVVGRYTSNWNMHTENAMIGDGNQIHYGAPNEDIHDIKSTVSEVLTKIQDGKMNKDQIIETMKGMEKKLSGQIDGCQKTITDQLKKIENQAFLIRNLLDEKSKLKTELQKKRVERGTIEKQEDNNSRETPLTERSIEEEIKQEPELSVPQCVQTLLEQLKLFLKESENERRSLNVELDEKGKKIQDVEKELCKLVKQIKGNIARKSDVNIFEFMKREHESLKRAITDISKERKIKEKDLLLTLEQSIQNETFLKKEYHYLQSKAENAKQELIQSNTALSEVKTKLKKLQTALQTETRTAFAAKTKLSNIVSCLQQLTGLQHGKEGQEWSVDEELVRKHLDEFIDKQKREVNDFETAVQIKEEHIKNQTVTITGHDGNMKKLSEAHEKTRQECYNRQRENLDLLKKIASLEQQLQQSEYRIHKVNTELDRSQREHIMSKQQIDENMQQIQMYHLQIIENNRQIENYKQQIFPSQSQQDGSRPQFEGHTTEPRVANRRHGLFADRPITRASLQTEKKETVYYTGRQDNTKEDL